MKLKPNKNIKGTGADEVIRALKKNRIKEVFVYPGGTIAPVLDLIEKNKINIFCSRHEQGAGYGAIAASKIKKTPQVTMVSSGPGVTNIVTPVADAYYDSIPLVIFTGQVGQKDMKGKAEIRQKGFQETDTISLFKSITKKCFQPKTPHEVFDVVNKAFEIASSGRPGPVLIDLPMNIQRDYLIKNKVKKKQISKNKIKKNKKKFSERDLKNIVQLIINSSKPLILCGQGIVLSKSEKLLRKLAIKYKIPVTMSLLALGAFPTRNYLSLGFHGHTGNQAAGLAIQNCDLLIVVGSRLDLRQVGTEIIKFAEKSKIVRIDIDKNEISNSRVKCNINIEGDVGFILKKLLKKMPKSLIKNSNWLKQIKQFKNENRLTYKRNKTIKPQEIIEEINNLTLSKETICVSGVGQHQQWTARHFDFDNPKKLWFTSGGHGAMGYDLPVAIGAQYVSPKKLVLCFVGDGSFQMNIQELASLEVYNLPLKIIVLDNNRLGIVSQFQKLNWNNDPTCGEKWNPSFSDIAKSYKIFAQTIVDRTNLKNKLTKFLNFKGPSLLHCLVDKKEELSPMLLAGQTLDKMWKNAK
ncbi:thiamine pyrophosphate-binding protein [Candidatus Pelagibacter sp.]|nr:thiamine pyrophosphate-binding protein [Candidatus Pelagibacter sp.]